MLISWTLLDQQQYVGPALGFIGGSAAIYVLYISFYRCEPVERDRMLVVLILVLFSILFWAFYEQTGSSLNLFSDRLVDRNLLGMELKASQLQALPALFVIMLAPIFSMIWSDLAARGKNPAIPVKFAMGIAFIGLAFLMPVLGKQFVSDDGKISLLWISAVFFFMVCGELCIAPISMNMITRLCPRRVVGMMMGGYMLSLSIGSFVAGQLAKLTSLDTRLRAGSAGDELAAYTGAFSTFGLIAMGTSVLLLLLAPLLHRRMHDS